MEDLRPVIIIGGGNSGCNLAKRYLENGVEFLLFEQSPLLGGLSRFKKINSENTDVEQLTGHKNIFTNAEVKGLTDSLEVVVEIEGKMNRYHGRQIFIATGSYETPIPFQGWTLPGVITSQAAETLFYRDGLSLGTKIIYAYKNSCDYSFLEDLKIRHKEVIDVYLNDLTAFKCMAKVGQIDKVVFVKGNQEVEIDNIDTVICSSTRLPAIELLQMIDVKVTMDANLGFYPIIDDNGETSRQGIFVIGSAARVNKENISNKG